MEFLNDYYQKIFEDKALNIDDRSHQFYVIGKMIRSIGSTFLVNYDPPVYALGWQRKTHVPKSKVDVAPVLSDFDLEKVQEDTKRNLQIAMQARTKSPEDRSVSYLTCQIIVNA